MRVSELKEVLNNVDDDLQVVFISSENNTDNYYQVKDSIFHEVVHINLGDIDDEKFFIKEYNFDDFYDKVVNSWEVDLSDENIAKIYEWQKWTKVLMFTLDD